MTDETQQTTQSSSGIQTQSRKALQELIGLLQEVDQRWASDEWNLASEEDIYGAHRALMHMLEGGLHSHFEADPARPHFRRIVTPTRKFTGDNGDAIYFANWRQRLAPFGAISAKKWRHVAPLGAIWR